MLQNLSKYFMFESEEVLCDQFDKFVEALRKEKEETHGKVKMMNGETCQMD